MLLLSRILTDGRKAAALLCAAAAILLVPPAVFCKEARMTLLYTSNVRGHLFPFDCKEGKSAGGISRRAELVKEIRIEQARSILVLDAGNSFFGTSLSSAFKGKADIEMMNMIGYDACGVGERDFDFGSRNLLQRSKEAQFPFVCANIFSEQDSKPLFEQMAVRNIQDFRVGITGIVSPAARGASSPENVSGLRFVNPKKALKDLFKKMKGKTDIIVVLSQCGFDYDCGLAEAVPGISIIISGSSRASPGNPVRIGKTVIAQSYQWGVYLGRLDFTVTDTEKYRVSDYRGEMVLVSDTVPAIGEIDGMLSRYNTEFSEQMKKVIGSSGMRFDNSRCRNAETEIGNLITDIIRRRAGNANVCFQNGDSIKAALDKGPITVEEMHRLLPSENHIVTMRLTGAQVEEAVKRSVSSQDRFLQVSGLNVSVQGGRVKSIMVGGKKLDSGKYYRVAVNDFLAAGGGGYDVFTRGKDQKSTGLNLRDAVIRHIQANKNITGRIEGRYRFY